MVGLGPNSAETALVRCAHRSLAVAAFRLRRILAFGRQMKMSVERSETRNERAKHRKRAKHRMRHSEAARPSKRQTAVSGGASGAECARLRRAERDTELRATEVHARGRG